ncbi:MAG: hypothetical protein ACOX7K_08825 [Oscillospiraceae bacterium]|jgi:hypothetical protein
MNRQYFDFSQLISDYANDFEIIVPQKAQYDDTGELVKGQDLVKSMRGAIIGFRESKIFRSEGAITSKDKHLFMHEPIPEALKSAKVRYLGQEYMIESETENAEFTSVYSYVLRWCRAFDTV